MEKRPVFIPELLESFGGKISGRYFTKVRTGLAQPVNILNNGRAQRFEIACSALWSNTLSKLYSTFPIFSSHYRHSVLVLPLLRKNSTRG